MAEIGGGWCLENITKGLPSLRRPKTKEKSQEKGYEIEKLYDANRYWNYWEF